MSMVDDKIFDLKDISDIPATLELRQNSLQEGSKKLLELFEIKKVLSINEILVGLYRKFNLIKTRVWVSSTLYNLSRKNIVKKVKGVKGMYEVVK